MILFMGTYNTNVNNAEGELIVEHVPGHSYTEFTQLAVTGAFPGLNNFGAAFVAFALFFFAFTTLMAYYYIAETNVAYLFSGRTEGAVTWILKFVMLAIRILRFSKNIRFGLALRGYRSWFNGMDKCYRDYHISET